MTLILSQHDYQSVVVVGASVLQVTGCQAAWNIGLAAAAAPAG